ncbi:MAG TPA: hypothetical protein VGP68_17270 [Gemmataceae bacterium]|jgi:hypothetical protein|nr:hypothetical protein [Gemmataceae bacterium]
MDRIAALLAGIGSTPEEIALALRNKSIRGHRGNRFFSNPVVRYLNRHLDIGGLIEVDQSGSILRVVQYGKVREMSLPAGISSFLDRFEQGEYRELEEG